MLLLSAEHWIEHNGIAVQKYSEQKEDNEILRGK